MHETNTWAKPMAKSKALDPVTKKWTYKWNKTKNMHTFSHLMFLVWRKGRASEKVVRPVSVKSKFCELHWSHIVSCQLETRKSGEESLKYFRTIILRVFDLLFKCAHLLAGKSKAACQAWETRGELPKRAENCLQAGLLRRLRNNSSHSLLHKIVVCFEWITAACLPICHFKWCLHTILIAAHGMAVEQLRTTSLFPEGLRQLVTSFLLHSLQTREMGKRHSRYQ